MTAVSNAVNAVIFPGSKESGIGDRRLKMLHIIMPHVGCLFASYGQLIIWLDSCLEKKPILKLLQYHNWRLVNQPLCLGAYRGLISHTMVTLYDF